MKKNTLFHLIVLLFLSTKLCLGKSTESNIDWQEKVDHFFGESIVSPLAELFFWPIPGIQLPLVVAWLLGGAIFFTLRMRFVNIRLFKHAIELIRGKHDTGDKKGEVTHFQALTTALSATVGLGNIAGVAIAIGTGGPGATFWMILVGFLGMSSKFTECVLGQKYRKVRKNGKIMGGAMHYLSDGLKDLNLQALGWLTGRIILLSLHWGILWRRECLSGSSITRLDQIGFSRFFKPTHGLTV